MCDASGKLSDAQSLGHILVMHFEKQGVYEAYIQPAIMKRLAIHPSIF